MQNAKCKMNNGIACADRSHFAFCTLHFALCILVLAIQPGLALSADIDAGGVLTTDSRGRLWIEQYVTRPPSHILNGFIWALWGVYDYARFTGDILVRARFDKCVATIESALPEYDNGHWSLYELPGGGTPMASSRDEHALHIAQLRVLERITGLSTFKVFADRWQRYLDSPVNRTRARLEKAAFKLLHSRRAAAQIQTSTSACHS